MEEEKKVGEKKACEYIMTKGKKKGEMCGTKIKGGGDKCGKHKSK